MSLSLFFRIIRHLLPDAAAWRAREGGTRPIERFLAGLAGGPADARAFIDSAYLDLYPDSTREIEQHEHEFALASTGSEAQRRSAIAAAWRATGGQSPSYLQGILQAAGFDVYLHDPWEPGGPPYVSRDPRDYTDPILIGTVQCGDTHAECGETEAQCDAFLRNSPNYLVNETLVRRPPPPVPDNPIYWRRFMYVGGATFPDHAPVPIARRAEFEALLLQLRPTSLWIVLLIDYEGDPEDAWSFGTHGSGEINPTFFQG